MCTSTEMQGSKERRLLKTVLAAMETGLSSELKSVRLASMELRESGQRGHWILAAKSLRQKRREEAERVRAELEAYYKQTLATVKAHFGSGSAEYERFCGA